jgi:trans-2,3-dihydro-3-hydroxyanthranilate isomerase
LALQQQPVARLRQFRYLLVDVFAESPYTGAPVAVFTDARGLGTETMQSIARELNREQTSFAFPARDPKAHLGVRIFTPEMELARAQCSTIATAFALDYERGLEQKRSAERVVFDGSDGPISVSSFARLLTAAQATPELGALCPDGDAAIACLGLTHTDCMTGEPIQLASSGDPFYIVPLRNRAAMRKIQFRKDIWERTIQQTEAPKLIAFTLETERSNSTATMRVFSPDIGVLEQAATEMACGPLAAYLVRYGFIAAESPQLLLFEQGACVGRPSFLHAVIQRDEQSVTSLRVGGQCVSVGEGTVTAPVTESD